MRPLVPPLLALLVSALVACSGGDPGDPSAAPDAANPPTCQPDCSDRSCGLDPICGTVCGTCQGGTCSADGVCDGGATCRTCAGAGAECGFIDDGCGNTLDCGGCGNGETCGAKHLNQCDLGACTPRTCVEGGAECGSIDDGCGAPLSCGTCSSGELCGAGGQPNVCAPPPSVWTQVATGAYHTCAIKQDGTLWCWGSNNAGQLGLGTAGGTLTTPHLVGVSFGWTAIATGGFHTCGIQYDHLYCWGENANNQLGDGTTTDASTPKLIAGNKTWDAVATGWNTTCARSIDQYCWGNNDYTQLADELGPVTMPAIAGDFYTTIALGGGHACYLHNGITGSSVWCGGLNTAGQLGLGFASPQESRTTLPDDLEWRLIFAGGSHTCAFANVGTLLCWGSNEFGQLGNPDAAETLPSHVDGLTDWAEMGLGDAHTCGVKENGNLYCWGVNDGGQLGDGSTTNRAQPVLIGSGFASVEGGYSHTCAIDTGNKLWCWGDNGYGQLGTGGGSASTPVMVP